MAKRTQLVRLIATSLIFTLLFGVGALFAGPDDDSTDTSIDAKERGRRERRLRIVALKYMNARKRYPSRCPRCQGTGKWLSRRGQRSIVVDCSQCAGNGAWVSDKHYKIVQYKMRTPAFQKLPGIKDLLEKEYKAARAGKPWPRRIARVRIKDVEMIDATHAICWVGVDADRIPTETRWVWVQPEGKKKGEWYAYDNRSDGGWPDEDARGQLESLTTAGWDSLTADEHRNVRQAIANARLVFRSVEYRKRGHSLLVRLVPRDAFQGSRALAYVGGDALKLSLAVMRQNSRWAEVQSEWLTQWKDRWDRTAVKPAWWANLTRKQFDQKSWKDMTIEEQIAVLQWKQHKYVEWTPLEDESAPQPKPAPKPDPKPDPAPEPGQNPANPAPEPDPVPEPGSTPQPTAPAPPAPTEPMAELDENFKIPSLTSQQEKKGNDGLEEINKLFERAKGISDEATLAHREGAHTLWQEKLAEVRSVLGEIEDVWYEQVVKAMPGRDDMEQDVVANHYFGDVWGELDKLKAMVRKVSTIGR